MISGQLGNVCVLLPLTNISCRWYLVLITTKGTQSMLSGNLLNNSPGFGSYMKVIINEI